MKNYLRHNFRRHYRCGKPRISILEEQPQDIKCSSDFAPPSKLASGCIPDKYQRPATTIDHTKEKKMKNSGWLDNLFWNHIPVSMQKEDLLGIEYAPLKESCYAFKFDSQFKKYLSACDFVDRDFTSLEKGNYKSAQNICPYDSINCEDSLNQIRLNTNSFVPRMIKCSDHALYFDCNRARSHCKPNITNNFLKPFNGMSDNYRSLTTLSTKSESTKTIIPDSSRINPAYSGQVASRANERDPAILYDKLKKRDFDWINSFSSDAVILQPSRAEFSIKKLINKTTCQERLWGLPPKPSFAKTLGPGMNDNIIQYTALKHKMQSELKKNNFIGEGAGTSQRVKKLIKSAEEKNRLMQTKKTKKLSTKSMARTMLNTIKDSISLKTIDLLKTKDKGTKNIEARRLQKVYKKRNNLNIKPPNIKVKEIQRNLLQQDKPIEKPSPTEYQSSASYKHVFQELFNKANKTKASPKPVLSFFNRQQLSQNFSRAACKLSSNNSIKKEKALKKPEHSSTVPERSSVVNLKNQARTPFQKPSNTQLTSKSKASFSTVSKISKNKGLHAVRHPKLLKKIRNKTSSPKIKTSKRSLSTNRKGNEENKSVIKKSLYSTLGYYPALPRRIDMKPKAKLKNNAKKKDGAKKENRSQTLSGNKSSGYYSQRRSLSSFGVLIGDVTGTSKTLTEPLNEQVFREVMSLCKCKEEPTEEKKPPSSEKEKLLKRYGRCSLQEKKVEKRRGFVCRIASMLNIGCGRRRRLNEGCPECGKKAG